MSYENDEKKKKNFGHCFDLWLYPVPKNWFFTIMPDKLCALHYCLFKINSSLYYQLETSLMLKVLSNVCVYMIKLFTQMQWLKRAQTYLLDIVQ